MSDAARPKSPRPSWRAAARAWGPPGNERLTTSTGLVLLALLVVAFSGIGLLSAAFVMAFKRGDPIAR